MRAEQAQPRHGRVALQSPQATPRRPRAVPRPLHAVAGFTLIEVLVAASLLLLTVVCVTPLLVGSRWTVCSEGRVGEARRLASSRLEHLSTLAFGPSSVPAGGGADPTACVVAALFPHADPALNRADDFVVLTGGEPWPAGSFVTRRREGSFVIATQSRFGAATGAGYAPVPASRLAGYAASTGGELPSGALLVTMRVSWVERGTERSLVRSAVFQEEFSRDFEALTEAP